MPSRAHFIPPMPASTRSTRWASSFPATARTFCAALEICRRLRCSITMRGGGTSQAGQAIGSGIQIDISKYYNRVLEVNAGERWVRVEPGHCAGRVERPTAAVGYAIRAGYFDRQPRHHRRHDGQQLQRRAQRALRQDHRPRAGTGGGAVRRQHRPLSRDPAKRCARRRHAGGRLLPDGAAAGRPARGRDRPALSEDHAARGRLQPGRIYRRRQAGEPRAHHGGIGRHAGHCAGSETAPGAAAESQSGDGGRCSPICWNRSRPRR